MADALTETGHPVSHSRVAELLVLLGYSLQGTVKTREGRSQVGKPAYPGAKRLLICADAGGSNGYRVRLWKIELAKLATDIGLQITVCHFPPGTSKWNKIEHRLFSHISTNWRGRPLTSHQVVVELIGATTTRTGLTVHAEADTNHYPTGIKISNKQIKEIEPQIKRHDFHGEWNYTIKSAKKKVTSV